MQDTHRFSLSIVKEPGGLRGRKTMTGRKEEERGNASCPSSPSLKKGDPREEYLISMNDNPFKKKSSKEREKGLKEPDTGKP